MPFVPASKFSDYERRVMAAPAYYTAMAFRGRAFYDKGWGDTMEVICYVAAKLYEDRPVAIYAVGGNGDSAMVGYWKK